MTENDNNKEGLTPSSRTNPIVWALLATIFTAWLLTSRRIEENVSYVDYLHEQVIQETAARKDLEARVVGLQYAFIDAQRSNADLKLQIKELTARLNGM